LAARHSERAARAKVVLDIHHDQCISVRNLHDRSSPKPILRSATAAIAVKKLKFLPDRATAAGSPSIPSANAPIRGARVPGCREETAAGQCAGRGRPSATRLAQVPSTSLVLVLRAVGGVHHPVRWKALQGSDHLLVADLVKIA